MIINIKVILNIKKSSLSGRVTHQPIRSELHPNDAKFLALHITCSDFSV